MQSKVLLFLLYFCENLMQIYSIVMENENEKVFTV
jgi:hypothetical protein